MFSSAFSGVRRRFRGVVDAGAAGAARSVQRRQSPNALARARCTSAARARAAKTLQKLRATLTSSRRAPRVQRAPCSAATRRTPWRAPRAPRPRGRARRRPCRNSARCSHRRDAVVMPRRPARPRPPAAVRALWPPALKRPCPRFSSRKGAASFLGRRSSVFRQGTSICVEKQTVPFRAHDECTRTEFLGLRMRLVELFPPSSVEVLSSKKPVFLIFLCARAAVLSSKQGLARCNRS